MMARLISNAFSDTAPEVVILEVRLLIMVNLNYIIFDRDSRDAVIVDPAWEMHKLAHALNERGLRLRGVLITHSHPDHLNLAKSFAAQYECPIWMSEQEIAYAGFHSDYLRRIDEPVWRIGALEIQALLTPGHTPGCICFRIGDNLFSGDVLFAEGCGICPTVEAARQMFDSLEYIKQSITPDTRIYPGHSYGKAPGQRFATLLRENIYLQFQNADAFAAYRMRPGQSWMKAFQFKSHG